MCMLWCCCAGLQRLKIHCAFGAREHAVDNLSAEVLACLTALTNLEELAVQQEGQGGYVEPWRLRCSKVSCLFATSYVTVTRCCCTVHNLLV
jgi:hypothetical protein